jgi:hypothetical protein
MATPSAQQSGLKLNVQVNLTAGITYDLWLDFDACKSVVEQGNGSYILKPVIRTFTEANSGAIAGMVSPANSVLYTYVVSGTDTLGTIPNVYGEFMIGGVPPGTYTVYFDAAPPFLNQTVSNVTVTVGNITQMGTISF